MKTIKRQHDRNSIIQALTEAQKLAFAPLAFQALAAMLDFGIFQLLDSRAVSEQEIINGLKLDEYIVRTLLQIAVLNNWAEKKEELFSLTKMGKLFLYDEMTKANFDFVKDVCYLGASELAASFKNRKPEGLHKFVGKYPTIYPALTKLPEKMRRSWYAFDHLYSDNCFDEVFKIISRSYRSIFDIGGNTGKFERVCFKYDENFDITMLDLPENIDHIKNDEELKNCKFHPINVLNENPHYPEIKNSAVFMSQFLDCFSKAEIQKILTDLVKNMDNNSAIYILEPFTDQQKYSGAEYSLSHISLYFTCMANGVSKMYTLREMEEIIKKSGLCITNCIQNIGSYDYTLLECRKNAMVSD